MSERLHEISDGGAQPRGLEGWVAGRARRREYWAWILPLAVASVALEMVAVPGATLIVGLPLLFAMIRRLHDMGRSGWLAPLINIAVNVLGFASVTFFGPDTGAILTFFLFAAVLATLGALPGEPRANAFGPRPGFHADDLATTFS